MRFYAAIIFLINFCTLTHCWQFFTTYSDLVMTDSVPDTKFVHSTYIFGDCNNKHLIFYTRVHLDSVDVLGKLIIRGWIDVIRIPTCIKLKGLSWAEDLVREAANNFQICVPRITYCHTHRRYKYYYYEWYLPEEFQAGIDWDIDFYGPPNPTW